MFVLIPAGGASGFVTLHPCCSSAIRRTDSTGSRKTLPPPVVRKILSLVCNFLYSQMRFKTFLY